MTSTQRQTPTASLKTLSGLTIHPDSVLGHGGEGEIWSIESRPDIVLKWYFPEKLAADPTLEDRIRLMVAQPPSGWKEKSSGLTMLTWPTDVVIDGKNFAGFLMPMVDLDRSLPLHRITNPTDARPSATGKTSWARGFTWRYLCMSALNLAIAVEVLHPQVVVGDFNESNVLVWSDARITLVDCDSMQITDPASKRRYLCRVGKPQFMPPELVGKDLGQVVRSPTSDLFALAVNVYQLVLEGEHPFMGVWHGMGDKPAAPSLARDGLWVWKGDNRLTPRPSAVGMDILPKDIAELFRRCFEDGARNPRLRPGAAEWRDHLLSLTRCIKTCSKNHAHEYFNGLRSCPWCNRDSKKMGRTARLIGSRSRHPTPGGTVTATGVPAMIHPTISKRLVTGQNTRLVNAPVPTLPATTAPAHPIGPGAIYPVVRHHRGLRRLLVFIVLCGLVLVILKWKHAPPFEPSPLPVVAMSSPATALVSYPSGNGYWIVSGSGASYGFGSAPSFHQVTIPSGTSVAGAASTPDGKGLWIVDGDGDVFAVGDARDYGSLASDEIFDEAVGIAPSSTGSGYWILGIDGNVFPFGDAAPHGSAKGLLGWSRAAGIASDPATGGYWITSSLGAVFSFDAPFKGAANTLHLNSPIVGIAAASSGEGYRLAATDGGVFSYGASFLGSLSSDTNDSPALSISSSGESGYWLMQKNGTITAFGAPQLGSGEYQGP
jgi:hypothetical protein